MCRQMDVAKLEKLLGYEFADPELLSRALTHRSWAHEKSPGEGEDKLRDTQNESLEFVGDSVVGLVIAENLFRRNPGSSEGDLTLMKHHLVSTATLSRIAAGLGLGEFVRLGRGEEKTGGREKSAILANTLEAVLGAVFFDGGYAEVSECVLRVFESEMANATPRASHDFKTLLQETLQARKLAAPSYSLLSSEGMPHSRTFVVEALWTGGRSVGSGKSIKSAEMMAASEALNSLRTEETAAEK
ncbi:MAG: ribonuclease III [Acidobacteria bacterium]|nr:ribonuclease III [Acidobacteriota bacterium]